MEESGRVNVARFRLLRVPDTLLAYQQVAANYRQSLGLKVVAITGSNGKTSTKDFVASVLARRFRVTKTEGNFNNHVGLPHTILAATREDEIARLGNRDESSRRNRAARRHSRAGRRHHHQHRHRAHRIHGHAAKRSRRKRATSRQRSARTGPSILNADDEFAEASPHARSRVILRRDRTAATFSAREIVQSANGASSRPGRRAPLPRAVCRCPGLHMVQNALLAVAAGRVFGLSLEECAAGLASAPLTKARLRSRNISGIQFIDDSYNANPDSMKAALRTLAELDDRRPADRRARANGASSARNRAAAIAKSAKRRRR